jgi:hypothetical protein
LIVTVPAAVTCAGCDSADQVSGLPPVAASNRPRVGQGADAGGEVKRTASVFCCGPVPLKVTRWRA